MWRPEVKTYLGKQRGKYLIWRGNTAHAQRCAGGPDLFFLEQSRGRVKAGLGGGQAGSGCWVLHRGWSGGWRVRRLWAHRTRVTKRPHAPRWGVQTWSSGWGSTSDPGGGGPTTRLGVGVGVGQDPTKKRSLGLWDAGVWDEGWVSIG